MNAPSSAASMRREETYGVSTTSERWMTRRATTAYALESRMPCRSSSSSEKMRCEVVVPMSMPTVRSRRRSIATWPSSPPWSWPWCPCAWVSGSSALDADREGVHPHLDAARGAALHVHAVDLRVLVLVLDLVAALRHVLVHALVVEILGDLPLVPAPADREVARRVVARVEVLVPPEARRHEERARLPVDLAHLARAVRPHERVALAAEHDHVVAGAVAMSLLVRADGEFGDVRDHRVVGELEPDVLAPGTALVPVAELESADVGDEVRLPDAARVERSAPVEVAGARIVAVPEHVGRPEDELGVLQEFHHDRHRRHREEARGERSGAVVQPVRRVERDGEQTALLPLEARRCLALVPHLAGATPGEDEEVLLEQVLLRRRRLSWRELEQITVVGVLGPEEADVRAARVEARPRRDLGRAQIVDLHAGVDRDALGLQEELVRAASPGRRTLPLGPGRARCLGHLALLPVVSIGSRRADPPTRIVSAHLGRRSRRWDTALRVGAVRSPGGRSCIRSSGKSCVSPRHRRRCGMPCSTSIGSPRGSRSFGTSARSSRCAATARCSRTGSGPSPCGRTSRWPSTRALRGARCTWRCRGTTGRSRHASPRPWVSPSRTT